ncbi:MAG: flavodoxin family protein [Peptoanaerobacter stomatis]|uniref:flavodoxin family protein n=1 Tax=Peptoanaerobacter stomatis TaxID=796937 RepID=UPI003F9EBAE0
MANIVILTSSPRKNGNTNTLVGIFEKELSKKHSLQVIDLYEKEIKPCIACRNCQKDWNSFNCIYKDDMYDIFEKILRSDIIILATPIYSWYCTPPMKSALDRLIYGMCKYYGDKVGPALWEGKYLALIVTCGYPIEKGADLFEDGIKRYCKHAKLQYKGMFAKRHMGYKSIFLDDKKISDTIEFAKNIDNILNDK